MTPHSATGIFTIVTSSGCPSFFVSSDIYNLSNIRRLSKEYEEVFSSFMIHENLSVGMLE